MEAYLEPSERWTIAQHGEWRRGLPRPGRLPAQPARALAFHLRACLPGRLLGEDGRTWLDRATGLEEHRHLVNAPIVFIVRTRGDVQIEAPAAAATTRGSALGIAGLRAVFKL